MRLLSLMAISSLAAASPLPAQECRPVRTALVLSGGGAKGLAHIGLLQALDSLGIRPDLVVGTSMGAIVGALYASGYTARQIDSLARGLPVSEVVRPFRPPAPHPWDRRIPLVFMVRGRHAFELQTGVVDEAQPNARLNAAMLRGNLLARGRFDRLPIPFRAVATDLRDRSTVVMAEGDLARAVRASSAIPLVFPPVVMGNAILVDGGLSANIPVAEARAAGAERVIVSDVTEHPQDSLDVESPLALADQLLGFLFQQPAARLNPGDVWIRPMVQGYRSLDFAPETVREILHRGRVAADTTLGKAACLPRGPAPAVPALPATLTGWSVTTGGSADSTVVARMLRLVAGGPIDPVALRRRLIGLADAEGLRGLWLNPTGDADSVSFRVEPVRMPNAVGGAGVAYDHELGARAWGGLFGRRLFGSILEGSVLASAGRLEREVYSTALWHFDAGWSRLTPQASVRVRGEDVRRFTEGGDEVPALGTKDVRAQAGLEVRVGESWRIKGSGDVLAWGQDGVRGHGSVGASFKVDREWRTGAQVQAEGIATGAFQSARIGLSGQIATRRWRIVPLARLGWGNDRLPAQFGFPLGGDDGFPGLHLGERRGSREASGSVRIGYLVRGPIQARLLIAAGRAWTPAAPRSDWLAGARLGFGADTPVGPVDASYGVASNGRHALFIRLGKWF